MSKVNKKTYKEYIPQNQKSSQNTIFLKDVMQSINTQLAKIPASLKFEFKYFILSVFTLLISNIYIHKSYLNNYNFKLILLISFYFSIRLQKQLYYHFHIKQIIINPHIRIISILFIILVIINIIYIFYDLVLKYSIYSLLPLIYFILLQFPIFFIEKKRYENPPKELIRDIKKVCYISLELCYYAIFIPVFFAVKNNPFLNTYAIFIYTIFSWINSAMFLIGFNFYKKSAEFYFYVCSSGYWKRISKNDMTPSQFSKIKNWSNNTSYEKDSVVFHKGKYYIGVEDKNFIEPNIISNILMYKLFKKPLEVFKYILMMEGFFTLLQCVFYLITQINVFSFGLLVCSWYTFYEIYKMNIEIKNIFIMK